MINNSPSHPFIDLFSKRVEHTFTYLQQLPPEVWTKTPVDSPYMFLGTRVNSIQISTLIRHIALAETHWFEQIQNLPHEGTIPFPANSELLSTVNDGMELITAYRNLHQCSMQLLANMSPENLQKVLCFAGRQYRVETLLWQILGHHSYHMGQVDILMRQLGFEPPEYMEWPQAEGEIA